MLREESNTLRSYGMFDKCVVHCLIAQQPSTPRNSFLYPQFLAIKTLVDKMTGKTSKGLEEHGRRPFKKLKNSCGLISY